MNAIMATWTNGQIVPSEPVDWPEGSRLLVEQLEMGGGKIGMDESDWDDSPEGIAKWIAAVEEIEPMIWAEGEEEMYAAARGSQKVFHRSRTKRMEEMGQDDAT